MTATIVQTFGAVKKTFGPFPVTPAPDFDEWGLSAAQLADLTRKAREQGAEVGYCDVFVNDDNGTEVGFEIAVI